jgi:hypothetical protein
LKFQFFFFFIIINTHPFVFTFFFFFVPLPSHEARRMSDEQSTGVLGKRKDGEPLFGRPPPGYRAGLGRGMVFGKGVGDTIGAALDGGGRRERLFGHSTQIAQTEAEFEDGTGVNTVDADDDRQGRLRTRSSTSFLAILVRCSKAAKYEAG